MHKRYMPTALSVVSAIGLFLFGIPAAICVSAISAHAADEAAVKILAARVRQQGFDCANGKSAKLDRKGSKPNETVWVLSCDEGSYRIRLVPDMAAKIEQLKQ